MYLNGVTWGVKPISLKKSIQCHNHVLVFHNFPDQDSGVGIIDSKNAASREMFSFDRANAQIWKAFYDELHFVGIPQLFNIFT